MLQRIISKFKNDDLNRLQKSSRVTSLAFAGANRRLSRLVPQPFVESAEIKMQARHLLHGEFLLSLALHSRTCCLHISSARRRSRASIVVLRGKALECIYTRKDFTNAVFGEAALALALADLSENDAQISGYDIDEKVAIASSALFSRRTHSFDPANVSSRPSHEYKKFELTKGTGCIYVHDENHKTLCTVYILQGVIVGVHAADQGWISPDISQADAIAKSSATTNCECYLMEVSDLQEIYDECFPVSSNAHSLLRFIDSVKTSEKSDNLFANFISTSSNLQGGLMAHQGMYVDEQRHMIEQVTGYANRSSAIKHSHSVNPCA